MNNKTPVAINLGVSTGSIVEGEKINGINRIDTNTKKRKSKEFDCLSLEM